jgi:hypothetical protein
LERIRQARELVEQLFGLLGPMEQARPWSGHVAQLRQVARGLGLDAAGATDSHRPNHFRPGFDPDNDGRQGGRGQGGSRRSCRPGGGILP